MCGRYLTPAESDFERHWRLAPPADYRRSFNVAPSQLAPVVGLGRDGTEAVKLFVWGFRPDWASRSWINARTETVFTSPAFERAAREHRCLVPAAGWYEWQGERSPKQPFVHCRDAFEPIAFAGIWTWSEQHGERRPTFAILTRPATPALAPVHDRMPALLDPAHYAVWLAPHTDRAELEHVLRAPGPAVASRRVSTYVNKPAHDDARCIAPPNDDDQGRDVPPHAKGAADG